MLYKILTMQEWAGLEVRGESDGSPADRADGYVHLSTGQQVARTAEKHFAKLDGLLLAALDGDRLGPALRWEPARGGALFPHLYRPLRLADIAWTAALPLGPDGRHVFPDLAAPA